MLVTSGGALAELAQEVLARRRCPEDTYEVAALLESMGITDRVAKEVYGVPDVFRLSDQLWPLVQSDGTTEPFVPKERINLATHLWRGLRSFLRGTIFALPMAVSVAAMLFIDLSLWSYRYLSLENATAIAIGTILSFMSIGGFTQAIAHRGFLYLGQGNYYTARRVAFSFVRIGFAICCLGALAYLLFNLVFTLFPWRMTVITLLYFLFLSAIWLSVTIMYMLQKELTFTGLLTGGIALVWFLFRCLHLPIIVAQLISLTAVSVAGILIAVFYFHQAEQKMEPGARPPMPRLSILAYTNLPYLSYGFLYFTFLFVDRVIAWSTNSSYMPYLIWFRGEYELGLDFALLALILPMGLIEVVVNELMLGLQAAQKIIQASKAAELGRGYRRLYIKRLALVTALSMLGAFALYRLILWFCEHNADWLEQFLHPVTRFVFIWAELGYVFIAVGLMNALVMFCLALPGRVIPCVASALLVDILVGFVLSRWFSYHWAVLGLTAGAITFAVTSGRQVWTMLGNLDYYLYLASS